jgi:hypothetical protein
MLRFLTLAIALSTTAATTGGCSNTPTIPGTDIPDTEESRAILEVLERYRKAFVARDAAGVLSTADRTYSDPAGTDDPSDDVHYDELGSLLARRLAQLESVRFSLDYLEIHVDGPRAVARVWVDASYRFKPLLGADGVARDQPPFQLKQDFAEFELLLGDDDGGWLIVRGI